LNALLSLWARLPLGAYLTRRALFALGALCSVLTVHTWKTLGARFALRALGARLPLGALGALCSVLTVHTWKTLGARFALRALGARFTLRPLCAVFTRRPLDTRFTLGALFTLRPLCAVFTRRPLDTRFTLGTGRPREREINPRARYAGRNDPRRGSIPEIRFCRIRRLIVGYRQLLFERLHIGNERVIIRRRYYRNMRDLGIVPCHQDTSKRARIFQSATPSGHTSPSVIVTTG
jgi:hypothetical protein